MNYQPTYNSRDERYKSPYGAVSSGTMVRFTLRPPRAEGFSHATLTARFESRNNQAVTLSMPWQGFELSQDVFTVQLDTKDYVGLVWYSFCMTTLNAWMGASRSLALISSRSMTVPSPYPPGLEKV